MGAPVSPATPLTAKPAPPPKKHHWWFRWRWFFLVLELLLLGISAIWLYCFPGKPPASVTFGQIVYALVCLDLSFAIYLYGVGPLSPHWKPDLPQPSPPDISTKAALGPSDASAAATHDHPLGPASPAETVTPPPSPNQIPDNPGQPNPAKG